MQTGGLAFSERRDVYAGYDHVPYLWIHGHHPHKWPKPPLGKVTVSNFIFLHISFNFKGFEVS